MTAVIADFFHTVFGDNVVLATILIAMLPLIELKGAIPFAMSQAFWAGQALNSLAAFCFGFVGSIIVVPVIALVFQPLYRWLKTKKFFGKIMDFLVGDVAHKSAQVQDEQVGRTQRQSYWLKILTIVLFVAFPVPLTGVWTGTCFAVLLGLDFWTTCGSVIFGNFICGLIITFVCGIFPQATTILLYVFLAIIIMAFLYKLVRHCCQRRAVVEEE